MAIGDVCRITASWSGVGGQLRQFVWHYLQTVAGDPAWADVLAGALAILVSAWAEIDGNIVTDVTGDTIELALWDSTELEWNTLATDVLTGVDGASATEAMPGNCAPYVTFLTDKARSRGKKFLFDVDEGAVVDGSNVGSFITAMASFGALFNNGFNVGAIPFRPTNFNYKTGDVNPWDSTALTVGIFSGSQYKRLFGRGE